MKGWESESAVWTQRQNKEHLRCLISVSKEANGSCCWQPDNAVDTDEMDAAGNGFEASLASNQLRSIAKCRWQAADLLFLLNIKCVPPYR